MSLETPANIGLFEAFAPMFASTVCGAVLIGFGQMLAFAARTVFYAEQCADLLRSQCVNAPNNHGSSDELRE